MSLATYNPNDPSRWFYWFLLGVACAMLVILNSCSCNSLMTRIEKKGCYHVKKDTLIIHDTLKIANSVHDTLFHFTHTSDTIRLNQDRLRVKYFYNTHDSTVYLKGECDSIIVYRDIKVPYDKNVFNFDYAMKYKWWIIGLFAVILLIIAILRK